MKKIFFTILAVLLAVYIATGISCNAKHNKEVGKMDPCGSCWAIIKR